MFSHSSYPYHPQTIHLTNFEALNADYRELMLDSAENEIPQPHERSIFDAVANAYDNASLEFSDDPFSATYVVRNCIRAVWEQRVWWDESDILDAVWKNVWQHELTKSVLPSEDLENMKVINDQAMSEYQELMGNARNRQET